MTVESVSEYYENMLRAIRENAPNTDLALVQAAYEYAAAHHGDQLRKDGSPYIIHPLATAQIVAEIGLDTDSILASNISYASNLYSTNGSF